ncbi:3-hydroxyacyl-CoA dehydrogenase NAD-binding domain-containing protein [Alphaproteobacteria bacterium]|nr:3-hydroxyacyl-CoA dehydrogenase NAD-binding domain-containing protein [Alphaproteobacteria bacterium]
MKSSIDNIAVIGIGVIGTGWIIRFLYNQKKIKVYDPNIEQKKNLLKEIKRVEPTLKKIYKKKINLSKQLEFSRSLKDAVENADLIQENAPENENLKKNLIKEISEYSKINSIIASSSSGILPSKIQSNCKNPKRLIIAHPFNPVYLLPLVELVAGKKTDKKFINKANIFYSNIGMKTLILKKELPGYLSDRLQESIWRESLHIINEGYASTQDLDDAIIYGPGLRWSLMGTFLTFHLAGGKMGMAHMLEQFGPALKLPWTKLKAPILNNKLKNKIINGTKKQSKNRSVENLSNLRDNFLIDLQKLLSKYKV